MFSKHGNNKPKGSMSSSKTFKTVTSSTNIENKFISGSGVGASSVATRRAKYIRSVIVTLSNVGKGGEGTGATLNSYYSGKDGGSGIVVIKYYT